MPGRGHNLGVDITTPVSRINRDLAGSVYTGRISHAYLFVAFNPGFMSDEHNEISWASGAVAFAARLNCQAPLQDSACGKCLSCQLIQGGNHPDVKVILPDGLSIKIHQIRDIRRDMSYKPRHDKGFRVTILECAEKMTQEAQNSFLKLLEEPPENVVFILATGNPRGLLPTIRSRCRQVRVILEHDRASEGFNSIMEKLRNAYMYSPVQVLEEAETIEKMLQADGGAGKSRLKLEELLVTAAGWFRDVLVFKMTGDINLAVSGTQNQEAGIKTGLTCDSKLYEIGTLIKIIDRIEEYRKWVRQNANIRLILEALLFDLRKKHIF